MDTKPTKIPTLLTYEQARDLAKLRDREPTDPKKSLGFINIHTGTKIYFQ